MLHTYSTDSTERRYIPFFIAAAAIGATFLVFHFLNKYGIKTPWWASPPIDTMAVYGLFYWGFNRFVWKWRILRWLRITRVPDVSGEWDGQVQPAPAGGSSAGLAAPIDIKLTIRQTWTELRVKARTGQSQSHSLSGAFVVADEPEPSLTYEFVNEPSAVAVPTMHAHHGVARLTLNPAHTVLEGEYYSGRDRQGVGSIRVTRSTR